MVIACLFCGGFIEITLIAMGMGALVKWVKNKHHAKKCKNGDCGHDGEHD